jgi:NAD(P)-dependent dehydrogenase (short-subunit alcohol dehydrogenase family)
MNRENTPSATVSVVTGANSGIGRATAIHLAAQGHRVYGTVRNLASTTKLLAMAADAGVEVDVVVLDIADDASVRAGLGEVLDRAGRVDVLVNNAGIGVNTVTEETSTAQYLELMNVNLCGAVRCIQAVLPQMRERRAGTIVNVSSVTGRVAAIAQAPYVASKWALEGMSEGLAHELAPFGIRVVIVEPGVTKSAIFAKNVEFPGADGPYAAHYRRMLQFYATGIAAATDPFEVAKVIDDAITTDRPRLRHTVSWGGPELVGGRRRMTDEAWVDLGGCADDAEYYERFFERFGLDIRPPSST